MIQMPLSKVVYAGWLEYKGTSILGMSTWTPYWFVLTENSIKHYKDDTPRANVLAEFQLDITTRIVLAESEGYSNFRFAVVTVRDTLELGVTDLDVRNMWISKLIGVAETKSALGGFVMRVPVDTDYQNVYKWERAVVAHSIDESSDTSPPSTAKASAKEMTSIDKTDYASFRPIGAWMEEFEPEVIQAQEQAKEDAKKPNSAVDNLRDHLVEDVVTNITVSSTTQFCNLLMDGIAELFALSERRLANIYRQRLDTKTAQVERDTKHSHTVTPPPSQENSPLKAKALDALEQDIPLTVLEHLLSALGSLRALALSYRFQDPSKDTQIAFTRRLAAHQLERSLSRVLKSLGDLQGKEQDKLKRLVEEAVHRTTDTVNQIASKATVNAGTEEAADRTVKSAVDTVVSTAERENAAIEKEYRKEESKEEDSLQHEAKLTVMELLKALIRPLLNREMLQAEAAPLMQEFLSKNKENVEKLQGLAKEVTQKLGDALLDILDKQIGELDELVLDQVEEVIDLVSEYTDPEFLDSFVSANTATKDTSQQQQQQKPQPQENQENREPQEQNQQLQEKKVVVSGMPGLATARQIIKRVAIQKDALKEKLAQYKKGNNVLYDGTNRCVLVMLLLEQTDLLWRQLQVTVQMSVSCGLYALLGMVGGGLSASAIDKHKEEQLKQGGEIPKRTPAVAGSAPVTTAVAAAFIVSSKPAPKPPA